MPGDFLRPQGALPPGYYSLQGGWVNRTAPEVSRIRGMPTGPWAFLGNAGRGWATALRRPHRKKGLVPYLPVRWGCNKYPGPDHFGNKLISDWTSPGAGLHFAWPCCRDAVRVECVSVPGDFLRPQGAFSPGYYSLQEGWVNHPAPEAPLIRGMPTGPWAFWENPGACGLRPCALTHRKKGLVPHLPVRWGVRQIFQSRSVW